MRVAGPRTAGGVGAGGAGPPAGGGPATRRLIERVAAHPILSREPGARNRVEVVIAAYEWGLVTPGRTPHAAT
jgi:hypothetical protein